MCMRPDSSWHLGHAQSKFTALTTSLLMDAERRGERCWGWGDEGESKDGRPQKVMPETGFEVGDRLQVDQESAGSPGRTRGRGESTTSVMTAAAWGSVASV